MLSMLLSLPAFWITPLAFSGALGTMLLVFALGYRHSSLNTDRLLLTGIVVAAGWSSIISLVLSLGPPMRLPGMLFWLMGDLSDALSPKLVLTLLLIGLIAALALAPKLNLAVYGMEQAAILGVDPQRLRWQLYFLASLLTAAAVSIAGAIGFIGLIVPHMIRLAGGRDHHVLLPVAVLVGGSVLMLADTLARTLISPLQLPVGVLTAVLGVPVFLWLLHRRA
jgi:iron complex transport system permease protein